MTFLARLLFSIALIGSPFATFAQETEPDPFIPDTETIAKARVIEVANERPAPIPGTNVEGRSQTLTIEVLDGPEKGMIAAFENDFTQLEVGDVFYARHTVSATDGTDMWFVSDPYRLDILLALAAAFLLLLFLFGGIQGIRGLASL